MELNEIVALLETQFPGVRKDGLNQLARVIAMQVNTKEEATQRKDLPFSEKILPPKP
jgi:hypothetical protein